MKQIKVTSSLNWDVNVYFLSKQPIPDTVKTRVFIIKNLKFKNLLD